MNRSLRIAAFWAGLWSLVIWTPIVLLVTLGAVLPDPGSIISLKAPWWFALLVWLIEPAALILLRKALRSLKVAIGLSALLLLLFAGELLKMQSIVITGICYGPIALLLPFILRSYSSHKPAD